MNGTLESALKGICLGEVQTFQNFAAFPILGNGTTGPDYITLGTALQKGVLKIEEVSEGGSVPDVTVINSGEVPVLLLDGEELAGAKQNRVLNTTVLLKAMSKTVINVSCTERGRWSYASREFMDSDVVMARNIRAMKNRSVSDSLNRSRSFRSNQGEIWEGIDALCASAGVCSETDAMRDIFEEKKNELHACLNAFPRNEKQRGLVFLIDGAVAGLDLVSRPEAYSELHSKLLRSYVIDSMPRNVDGQRLPNADIVHQFIEQVFDSSETSFPSVGLGTDYRYERREVCGSALVLDDTCVHAAFFSNVPFEDGPRMRGFRQRRGFRQ